MKGILHLAVGVVALTAVWIRADPVAGAVETDSAAERCKPFESGMLNLTGAAYCHEDAGEPGKDKACEIDQSLTVPVDPVSLTCWQERDPTKHDPTKLILFVNGLMLKGLPVRAPGNGASKLVFDLGRIPNNEENRTARRALLSEARRTSPLRVRVGLDDGPTSNEIALKDGFAPVPGAWLLLAMLPLVALLLVFLAFAGKSDLIRDPGPEPPGGKPRCFSLARSQMAIWFFLVMAAYIFIWVLTGDTDSLTSEAVILIGISAATGLGSAAIDSSQGPSKELADLTTRRDALQAAIAGLQGVLATPPSTMSPADIAAAQSQLAAKQVDLTTATARIEQLNPWSEGWFRDVLRDDSGVSFYRFQMLGWTIVLGMVFTYSVWTHLTMPEFGATLLGLMGVSSTTYIGSKVPAALKQ